jgi:hypothetical protein
VFQPNQRVKVDLSGMTIKGVSFSQNVREAPGTILRQTSAEPPSISSTSFSFKGVKRVEVPQERIQPMSPPSPR